MSCPLLRTLRFCPALPSGFLKVGHRSVTYERQFTQGALYTLEALSQLIQGKCTQGFGGLLAAESRYPRSHGKATGYLTNRPPSISRVEPVIQVASSEAR